MTNAATVPAVEFLANPPLNLTQRKARYGVVYLRALAGQAGCTFGETEPGEDVQAIDAKLGFRSGDVFVQVKTTHKHALGGNTALNYTPRADWLDKWDGLLVPAYFVVVVVPNGSGTWLNHAVTGTEMTQTAAFWSRIDPAAARTANKISVPRTQRLTAATLADWENDLRAAFSGGA